MPSFPSNFHLAHVTRGAPAAKPGQPSAPSVSGVEAESARLSWEAPSSDGGKEIGNYVVEKRDVTSSKGWTLAAKGIIRGTSTEIAGLTKGTTYEFRVSAENEVGIGDPSPASQAVTCEGKPGTILQSSISIWRTYLNADTEAPRVTTGLEAEMAAKEKSKVKLTVKFAGKPAPELHWFRNGREIFNGKRVWIETQV